MWVPPERMGRWLEGFTQRHGPASYDFGADLVSATGTDGAVARIDVPFPPLDDRTLDGLLGHVARERRIGVLLVRRGGYGVGVFDGARLASSKVGSRHVQGTTKAGGWSQQRFARRRENQAREAFGAAADAAARILAPVLGGVDAVYRGGDKRAVAAVLADPRLAAVAPLLREPFLAVADPRRHVLEKAGADARRLRVTVTEPAAGP